MSYKVYITTSCDKDIKALAKKYPSIKNDLSKLVIMLADNPILGQPIGKNCYKIRLAITSKGKGKSGGGRVITCVKIVENTVYLIRLYDKSAKEALDDNELDTLLGASRLL